MNRYSAFGLGIHSEIALPELNRSNKKEDIAIRFGKLKPPASLTAGDGEKYAFQSAPDEVFFYWREIGSFRVTAGREVVVDPLPDIERELLRLPLLGMILGVLLQQRGFLVLHASAVAVGDSVVAFVGGKGWGKSTTAATLYARGHRLLTDDVLAVTSDEAGNPLVIPGYPQFRLWPDAVASATGIDPENLPRLCSGYEKRAFRVSENFSAEPLAFKTIYNFAKGDEIKIRKMPVQEALLQILGNSFVARFDKQFKADEEAVRRNLTQCAELAGKVSVCTIERPHSLSLLPELARRIENGERRDFSDSVLI
jgi:hypothetical protein